MREIKFRGRHIITGEWQYGYLLGKDIIGECVVYNFEKPNKPVINWFCIVSEETIGQFTGLRDKQSKEIYEGDIMSSEMGNGRVTWVECSGKFVLEGNNFLINPWDGYEVIGNVFENPNLLTK